VTIRSFVDKNGVYWRVWNTHPGNPNTVAEDLRTGWLTFDSTFERRRLAPIPTGWESFPPERLELACRAAEHVRRSDPRGVAAISEDDRKRES
jgi:hypothetical protein